METTSRLNSTSTTRQIAKRTFSESDSASRTERHLCSFSHLWIINYLSSYLDDPNCTCLQSESFSPVNSPYSNTRWSLKLYPRGLNEKQHPNNNLAIFLKYISGTLTTIKAKAEFSVVSRNSELVMLRSTNFHLFSSGNDWGYSEFLDGNYLHSRRNDLLTDDRLRVYVRVILVDEKETIPNDLTSLSASSTVVSHLSSVIHSSAVKLQATSSSSITCSVNSSKLSTSALFTSDKDRWKSFEILSNHLKNLLDDERFTDVNIHVVPKEISTTTNDDFSPQQQRKSSRLKRNSTSCLSCHCSKIEPICTRRTTRSRTAGVACSSSTFVRQCSCFCHDQNSQQQIDENCSSFLDHDQMQLKYSNVKPLATFHAHRSILIARSTSFGQYFRLHSSSSYNFKSPPVDFYIDDLEVSTVRSMLIYIYTGRLPTCKDESNENLNPIDLFRSAVKFQLNELRDAAKANMLETLKIENAIEMLEVSDQANDSALKEHVYSFIRSNASAVSKTNNWFNISKRHPHLIIDAFRSLVTPNSSTTKTNVNQISQHSTSLTTTSKYSNG